MREVTRLRKRRGAESAEFSQRLASPLRKLRVLCASAFPNQPLLLSTIFFFSSALNVSNSHAIQQRNIEVLTPRSGTRGTTVEVLIEGLDLSKPKQILFYRPGIKAIDFQELPPRKRSLSLHHGGRVQHRIKCKFVIAKDCPLGEHPLRLRTATTLTTVATFWVGRFPIVPELERGGNEVRYLGGQLVVVPNPKAVVKPNDTLKTAQPIPLNVTVAGEIKVTSALDRDYYKVQLRKGQRLSVEVDSVRLCDKAYAENEYDLQVRVLDQDGREVASNDDSDLHVQDPILSMIAKKAGTHYVEIRQQLYKGGRWIFYRAHIGDFCRPLIAYPLGGPSDRPLRVRLLGDAKGPFTQTVKPTTTRGDYEFYPGKPGEQPPSSLILRASDARPNVMEELPKTHRWPLAPDSSSFGFALNGIITKRGEEDVFAFAAKKGQRFKITVFARTLGSPLDPTIWIRKRGDSKILVTADDARWKDRDKPVIPRGLQRPELLDPAIVFTAPAEGKYEIGIRDMRGLGGERFVYRVEFDEPDDVIHTHTVSMANDRFEINRTAGFIVPRGNRWTINIHLAQGLGNRYAGKFALAADGLPDGVRMIAPIVPNSTNVIPVQFEADADVKPQAFRFTIGAVSMPNRGLPSILHGSSQAYIPFINHSGGRAWHHVHLKEYALAVTDPAPFSLELEQPRIPISQAGELRLKVRVHRRKGFDEPVDIAPDWLPAGISSGGVMRVPAGKSTVEYPLSASRRAREGDWKIAMNGTTTRGLAYSGVGRIRVSSKFVKLKTVRPFVRFKFLPAAVRRNGVSTLTCNVTQRRKFTGVATAKLLGLPKGVSVVEPAPTLKPGQKTMQFQLKASRTALLGQYRQLRCELTFVDGGQSVRQLTESGVLRVDPEGKSAKGNGAQRRQDAKK